MTGLNKLHWDSDFFGRSICFFDPVAPYDDEVLANHLQPGTLLVSKIPAANKPASDYLLKHGFVFVESEIVFEKKPNSSDATLRYMKASLSEMPDLFSIVRGLYTTSRFREPWFSNEDRDRFYEAWVENAIRGTFDDCCLISKNGADITGFVTIRSEHNTARIGLIGVASTSQGQGIGSQLIGAAEEYCQTASKRTLFVNTQGSNDAAKNLYVKNKFDVIDEYHWYYKVI